MFTLKILIFYQDILREISKKKKKRMSFENPLNKSSPPPLDDDRSKKKTKFRQQGEDGDNPPALSFRDKLMESQQGVGDGVAGRDEFVGTDDYIKIENDDVVIKSDDIFPSIAFSQKVHEQLIKPWQKTVVIKLLGRMIGYKTLVSKLEAVRPNIWSSP